MLGWVVVTEKLVAVPVELQTTPPEPLKPGSVLHAPEAYVLLSTKYASWAVAALRASDATRALKPRERYAANCGIAIAARMPMIATTTSSSISVKPLDVFLLIFETVCILSPWLDGFGSVPTRTSRPSRRCLKPSEASEVPRGRKRPACCGADRGRVRARRGWRSACALRRASAGMVPPVRFVPIAGRARTPRSLLAPSAPGRESAAGARGRGARRRASRAARGGAPLRDSLPGCGGTARQTSAARARRKRSGIQPRSWITMPRLSA